MVLLGWDAGFTWFPSVTKYPREHQKFILRLGRNGSQCPKWSYRVGQPSLNAKKAWSPVFSQEPLSHILSVGQAGQGMGRAQAGYGHRQGRQGRAQAGHGHRQGRQGMGTGRAGSLLNGHLSHSPLSPR